jgi:hypothetical protein
MKEYILKKKLLGSALAALATMVLPIALTRPASAQTSVVFDPVGDVKPNDPAFEDIVRSEIQKTVGSFILRMEMAGPIPANPRPLPPGTKQIWWVWAFDLDPTTNPEGYPFASGYPAAQPEFLVYVSWDGMEFGGYAIDRRPLLAGGNAVVTPVPFSINGAIVEAVLAPALINAPSTFRWGTRIFDWNSSHLETQGFDVVDIGGDFFNPFP